MSDVDPEQRERQQNLATIRDGVGQLDSEAIRRLALIVESLGAGALAEVADRLFTARATLSGGHLFTLEAGVREKLGHVESGQFFEHMKSRGRKAHIVTSAANALMELGEAGIGRPVVGRICLTPEVTLEQGYPRVSGTTRERPKQYQKITNGREVIAPDQFVQEFYLDMSVLADVLERPDFGLAHKIGPQLTGDLETFVLIHADNIAAGAEARNLSLPQPPSY